MKAIRLISIALIVSFVGWPSSVFAYCTQYNGYTLQNWVGYNSIPVFVDKSLAGRLSRLDGSFWTDTELRREVYWATRHISTYSGADLPHLYYAGLSPDCGGTGSPNVIGPCNIPNAINLTYGLRGAPAATAVAVAAYDGMVISFNEQQNYWNTATSGGGTFLGALTHELHHTLGFSHPSSCGQSCAYGEAPCSAVSGGYGVAAELQHLYLQDLLGLRSMYGPATRTSEDHHEEYNHNVGTSWWDVPDPLPSFLPLAEASGAPSAAGMLVGGRSPTTLHPVVHHWDWASFLWTTWDPDPFLWGPHVGRVGAAWNHDSGHGIVGWQYGETVWVATKTLSQTLYSSPSGFATTTLGSTTRRPGVSVTYQDIDDVSIFATRSNSGQIELHWVHPTSGYAGPFPVWDSATGAPMNAYDTPSVDCGDEPGFYYNCLLAWAADDNLHTLRWMHFGIHPDGSGNLQIEADVVRADNLMLEAAPRVIFRGPASGPSAWMLAFTQKAGSLASDYVFTMHKGIHWTSLWDPQTLMSHGPYNDTHVASALGSANLDVELLVTN
ncbi:MAG: hypothetical protein DRJ42_00305 [Deltaproteobacteria bacterium]|nr:MAG: hypothetical protein DRJ42_00305 [Deltaproteobacteria bacterium]